MQLRLSPALYEVPSFRELPLAPRCILLMLLTISDRDGFVDGADAVITTKLGITKEDWSTFGKVLVEAKKIIRSKLPDGFWIVAYPSYSEARSNRKTYMREYMADRRRKLKEAKAQPQPKVETGYVVPNCFEKVEGFSAALGGWIESRKRLRKPATGRAIQLLVDRLKEHPERSVEALNAAVERGWTTVKWEWLDRDKPGRNGTDNANLHSKESKYGF